MGPFGQSGFAPAEARRGSDMNFERLRWRYWIDVFRGRQLEQDLDDEIQAHVALEIQRRIEQGESADAARQAALSELRSVALVKEATREAWAWRPVERAMQDLRYAFRMMRKNPLFSALAFVVMGLGIGAS